MRANVSGDLGQTITPGRDHSSVRRHVKNLASEMYSFARCSEESNLNKDSSEERNCSLNRSFKPVSSYQKWKAGKGDPMQIALEVSQLDWRSYFAPHVKSTDQNFEKAMLEYFLKGDLALWIVVRAGRSYLAGLVCIESDFSLGRWTFSTVISPRRTKSVSERFKETMPASELVSITRSSS